MKRHVLITEKKCPYRYVLSLFLGGYGLADGHRNGCGQPCQSFSIRHISYTFPAKSTRLLCFEIPLTKAEPANNGLRFAIYKSVGTCKSRNCDLYIAHL